MTTPPILKSLIGTIPDFPKPGIRFRDISPLLADPDARTEAVERMIGGIAHILRDQRGVGGSLLLPDAIVAVEARGFILGAMIAHSLEVPLIMARKKDKLPGDVVTEMYSLEYGREAMELQRGSLRPGQRVIIVDDVLATGGTAEACGRLVEQLGATVEGLAFLIDLNGLGDREQLARYACFSLMSFNVDE